MKQLEEIARTNSSVKKLIKRFSYGLLIAGTITIPIYIGARVINNYNLDNSYIICFVAPGLIGAVGEIVTLLNQSGPRMNEYIPPKKSLEIKSIQKRID